MNKRSVLSILLVVVLTFIPTFAVLAANLLSNPSIESGTGGDADNWTESTNAVRSNDRAHDGTYSMRTTASSQTSATQDISVTSSTTYYLSVWIYRTGAVTGYLDMNDHAGELTLTATQTDAWEYLSGSWVSDLTGTLTIRLMGGNAAYFDQVCISETEGDCDTAPTPTPTSTPTPTETPTPTATGTNTPTPTATTIPAVFVWADGMVTLSEALLDAIEDLLTDTPPEDAQSTVYAVTNVSGVDTAWNVSLVNLVDVSPPYEEWDMETNAVWSWFVTCTGEEPTWECVYYELPPGGGSGSLMLPWRSGYSAIYGVSAVHRDNPSIITGSYAVDFVGGDAMGTDIMPATVIAASDGTITSVCSDGTSMAIRVDGGPVPLAYFHFATGQVFSEGQSINQGQVLGSLKYGTFSGSGCGWGTQAANQYHLHFVFLPTTSGYLEIGGCVLNLSSENFICNSNTYGPLAKIPNGGDDGGDVDPPPSASGGAHIWDGIVAGIMELSDNTVSQVLPEQMPIVSYVFNKILLLFQAAFMIFAMIYLMGLSGNVLIYLILTVVAMEYGYLQVKVAIWLGKTFLPFLRGLR